MDLNHGVRIGELLARYHLSLHSGDAYITPASVDFNYGVRIGDCMALYILSCSHSEDWGVHGPLPFELAQW